MRDLVRRGQEEARVEDGVDLRRGRDLARAPCCFGNRAEHMMDRLAVAELRRESWLEADEVPQAIGHAALEERGEFAECDVEVGVSARIGGLDCREVDRIDVDGVFRKL